jgi:hypothetical protein
MPDNDVRINVTSTFSSEGSDKVQSDALELRASYGSIWEFFQRATPEEIQRMSHTALRDVTPAGVTGDLATAGYRQQLEAEELERIRSLNASFQELDVSAQQFRKTLHSFVTDWLWERRFRDDPYWGPRFREWQEEQERQEQETLRDRHSQRELTASAAELARSPDDDVALVLHAANVLKARESRGNYAAINEDAYGPDNPALGAYQILASNLGGPRGWDTKHLGHEITREEFLANPMLQDQIARGQLMEYLGRMPEGLSLEERARRLAVAWYAGPGRGDANLLRDTSQLSDRPVVYTYEDGTWHIEAQGRRYDPSEREIERLARYFAALGVDESLAYGMAQNRLIDGGPAVLDELPTGYRSGGFTGDGAEDDVAGIVHRGEFVVRADETRRHRELLERLNAGADEAALLAALAASSPAPADSPQASGATSVVRFEGEGLLRIEVDERVPEGARLERYLAEGLQRWQGEVRSRFNQGARRG